ncbi:MAG TPA: HAMP domain-containing sensor histidine kinase, partial [Phycisphaerae bacterium]|nr:HAMP domain-containing sensor histidine kinase [Phycisphaerae bacterium]
MSASHHIDKPGESPSVLPAPAPSAPAPNSSNFLSLTDRELFARLGWFVAIRWAAGVSALLLVLIGWYGFDVWIPFMPVVLTICALFMYNAVFLLLVTNAYRRRQVSRRFIVGCANAQMICDLLTLAVLMHFTGGVENSFLIFFICPMIIAAQLLSARQAYAHAALGTVLIHAIAWSEYAGWLPHVRVGEAMGTATYNSALVVAKFTIALSCLLFAVVFLESSVAARLRQREGQLEEAYHRVRELEKSKSFFMRKTTHELRAPLHAAIAMLQAICAEAVGECGPALRDSINRVVQRTLGLSKLIEELHRFAMLREAESIVHAESVNLEQTVNQQVGMYRYMADEKTIALTLDVEPAVVRGDSEALTELVSNLIVNAIQYTPAGGAVSVHLRCDGEAVRLEVRDTGIGIAPDEVPRVFDEFYRTGTAKKTFRNGTGMGLPIVQRIVEAHNGTIAVRSQV